DDLAEVDVDFDGGAVHLLPGNALDVDDPLPVIHLHDLAVSALVGPPPPPAPLRPCAPGPTARCTCYPVGREKRAHQHAPTSTGSLTHAGCTSSWPAAAASGGGPFFALFGIIFCG
ncbi:unnamed protein product, partial [Musa hybrid cultivar]